MCPLAGGTCLCKLSCRLPRRSCSSSGHVLGVIAEQDGLYPVGGWERGFAGIAACVTGSTVRQWTFPLGRESPILVGVLWPHIIWHGLSGGMCLMCHSGQQRRFQSEIPSSQCSVNNAARSGRASGRDVVPR